MGIGGLDNEFSTMFRRAFASRVMPIEFMEKMGMQHVKGILLYGPPGTGKTLMARQVRWPSSLQALHPQWHGPQMPPPAEAAGVAAATSICT